MSYKITFKEDAKKYMPAGHYDCLSTRLNNKEDVNDGVIVHGLTHFLPGGYTDPAPANFEMVYYIVSGTMQLTMKNEDGTESVYDLTKGDSVHFGKGTVRSVKNVSDRTAQMMTIMVKP